ncbi:hypothetical protein AX16_010168 [Volvariella volvacea WC 439]|nr:hypothetical protein AX16_010168 [Volvariella volvacea WC 439]
MPLIGGRYIPQELVDAIVNKLASEKEDLKSCSLISQAWSPSAQRLLFSRWTLTVPSEYGREIIIRNVQRFQDILSTLSVRAPSCLEYIQELSLRIGNCRSSIPALVGVVARLVNLKRLSLDFSRCSEFNEDLIFHCLKPTITHATIYQATSPGFPSHLFHQCSSLQELVIDTSRLAAKEVHVLDEQSAIPESLASHSRVPINSLTVHGFLDDFFNQWLDSPKCPITIQNLTSLSLSGRCMDFKKISRVLSTLSRTLESLKLTPPQECLSSAQEPTDSEDFILIKLSRTPPRLKRLEFNIEEDCETPYTYFPWLMSQLLTISIPDNMLEYLVIRINLDEVSAYLNNPRMQKRLGKLDNILAKATFDRLREVHILVENDAWIERPIEDWVWLGDVLPRMRERRKLLVGSEAEGVIMSVEDWLKRRREI